MRMSIYCTWLYLVKSFINTRLAIILCILDICDNSIIVSGRTQSQSTVLSPDVVSCPDVEVTFTCQVSQQSGVLVWRITLLSNGIELMDQLPQDRTYFMSDQPGSSTVMSGGFSFHFILVETSPALQSTMRTSGSVTECHNGGMSA